MALKKEDFTSFEIYSLDGERLLYVDSGFDFPIMYDSFDNIIENMLMIKGKKLPELSADRYIYVVGNMKNGDRVRYKTYVSVSSAFQMNVQLRADSAEIMEERRRYFKIKTYEKAYITFSVRGDDDTKQYEPPAEVIIKDINVGGVFIMPHHPPLRFQKGDRVMLVINLGGRKLELFCEVLRNQPVGQETGYGCRFVSTTSGQEEIISRYIYRLQFERMQKDRALHDS